MLTPEKSELLANCTNCLHLKWVAGLDRAGLCASCRAPLVPLVPAKKAAGVTVTRGKPK